MKAEDKKNKEAVETRNMADSLVYNTERTLNELGDKISADDKARIQAEADAVKEALKGTDNEAIKAASEKLAQVSQEIFGKIYSQAQAQANNMGADAANGGANASDGNTYDADYEVVDEDK